jgi:hypothetical protein
MQDDLYVQSDQIFQHVSPVGIVSAVIIEVAVLASGTRLEGMEAEDPGKLLQSYSEELCSKGLVELEQCKAQDEQNDDEARAPLKVHSSEFYLNFIWWK